MAQENASPAILAYIYAKNKDDDETKVIKQTQHLAGASRELLVASRPELLLLPPPGMAVEGVGPSRGPVFKGLVLQLLDLSHAEASRVVT